MQNDFIYDIECYPNIFTMSVRHAASDQHLQFEISRYRNDIEAMMNLFNYMNSNGCRMVGFNNIAYDYPVIHYIIANAGYISIDLIYKESARIIATPWNMRHMNSIYPDQEYIEQIDLFKIHHFDNFSKSTSLKAIEVARRAENIGDLPYPPGEPIPETAEAFAMMHEYNGHDTAETKWFYKASLDHIRLRETMREKYDMACMNYNSGKIGKEFFIKRLPPEFCYYYENGKRHKRQTHYPNGIDLASVIFPYVKFNNPEFERVRAWLAGQRIMETKGVFKGLYAEVGGLKFKLGTGGLHASLLNTKAYSDENYQIIDVDVASFYPNLAIANNVYPAHMGPEFCKAYADFYAFRQTFKKGTAENGVAKLGLNSVYGDSNNDHSVFRDPKYTMTITINGQLLLCMLAEWMLNIHDCKILQVNTDGLTVRVHRSNVDKVNEVIAAWEAYTLLTLEANNYDAMYIRDVNSYIAVNESGKIKRIGAYRHGIDIEGSSEIEAELLPQLRNYKGEIKWHQDHGAYIVAIAAEAFLLHGTPIAETVTNHPNALDFMMSVKTTRAFITYIDDEPQQKMMRYYVSLDGGTLYKIKQENNQRTGIHIGWRVTECNNLSTFAGKINAQFYIEEAKKLVDMTTYRQ